MLLARNAAAATENDRAPHTLDVLLVTIWSLRVGVPAAAAGLRIQMFALSMSPADSHPELNQVVLDSTAFFQVQ